MSYCTTNEVKLFTGVKPISIGLNQDDNDMLDEILNDWISQAEGLINSYTNNNFKNKVPYAVKHVCLRITANMVALSQARKETPIVQVNDWKIDILDFDVFNEELRENLSPFIIEHSTVSDTIDFFTITGD